MTKDELFKLIDLKVDGLRNRAIIKDAVEDYSSASNNGKPIVSGSLPVWAAELLTEVRFRLLFDMDNEGELRSSMAELLGMWDKVNKALNIKTVGQ